MEIINKKVEELIPYEKNPRINDEAVKYVANRIKEFGFKVPIVIDKDNVIIAGHTRLKASKELGLTEVPCIIADDLSEEQIKAFRLADNKVSEQAKWDFDLLSDELNGLDMDMEQFGFIDLDLEFENEITGVDSSNEENPYTAKINIPQYEIKGEEPTIAELVETSKTNELIKEIQNSKDITEEQREFLIKASQRHLGFNYSKIAEYYAHQDKPMQELMEKSALIIIDYDDAIKNGYAELLKGVEDSSELLNDNFVEVEDDYE